MPITSANLTRPLPRAAVRRPRRPVQKSGGPGAPLSQVLGGWNFLARVWISFDPPNTPLPTWIEITGFVETDSTITITHGRADGIGDVNATTCQLTIDNSDGRFCPDNPNGVWYGLIDLGCWLRVDVLAPSGNVFNRFTGHTNNLPTGWQGQYASSLISAADRFEKLGQAPVIVSQIQSEVLTDPNLAGGVKGYWNLHEAQGSLTFGDTSGQSARHLTATGTGGVPAGTGFAAANVAGPGFDGLRAATFNPASVSQGTYLTGPITCPTGTFGIGSYTGLFGTIELWFQATTTGVRQMLFALVDPIAQFGMTFLIDSSGYLGFSAAGTTPTNTANYGTGVINILPRVDDGKWHQILLGIAATNAGTGTLGMSLVLDGAAAIPGGGGNSGSGVTSGTLTQIIIGAGYDGLLNNGILSCGASNIAEVAWMWADMPVTGLHTATAPPDAASHYAAGTTGFLGESTDTRIARVARYAGIPIPTATVPNAMGQGTARRYAGGLGPWTNLSAGAHTCGTQSMAGRGALDVIREAARTELMPPFVDRSGYLTLQPSTLRQNTTPAWTVDARDLDPSTGLAKDFAYMTNRATITPNGQAAQTVVGPYGAASQARYGVYAQGGSLATASVNPIEAQSLGYAVVQQRSVPLSRLAPLVVEAATLATQPGYGIAWYDAVLGSEISTAARVTNTPVQMGGGNSDVLLEGWTETITAGNHTFSFSTSPVQAPTYQLDDVVFGHLDTDGTSLTAGVNTTATTLSIAVVSNTSAAWTTNPADFPFDVLVDTERMTATAVTPVALGVDGTFETSATGWTLSNCTLAQSAAQAHTGTSSGLITALASGSFSATTPQFAVYAGATYQVSQWFLLASGAPSGETVAVRWFTSGGASLGQVILPNTFTPTSTWLQQQLSTLTAPATAAFATVGIGATAAAAGNAMYIDDVTFPLLLGGQQQMTVTRSVNGVVATHSSSAALALFTPLTLAY